MCVCGLEAINSRPFELEKHPRETHPAGHIRLAGDERVSLFPSLHRPRSSVPLSLASLSLSVPLPFGFGFIEPSRLFQRARHKKASLAPSSRQVVFHVPSMGLSPGILSLVIWRPMMGLSRGPRGDRECPCGVPTRERNKALSSYSIFTRAFPPLGELFRSSSFEAQAGTLKGYEYKVASDGTDRPTTGIAR